MNIPAIEAAVENLFGDDVAVQDAIESILNNVGSDYADACVAKQRFEHPNLSGTFLAQAAFEEFKHGLRCGFAASDGYVGVTAFPALDAGADVIYADGSARSTIHDLCNASAAKDVISATPVI